MIIVPGEGHPNNQTHRALNRTGTRNFRVADNTAPMDANLPGSIQSGRTCRNGD
jgi:hypothetical protein